MGRRPARPRIRPGVVDESVEQTHTVRTARWVGGRVYVLGTRRSRGCRCPHCKEWVPNPDHGTHQTSGIPDLEIFLPSRTEPGRWVFVKMECKSAVGKLSSDQQVYRDLAIAAGVVHITGGHNAFIAYLLAEGYIREGQVPHYRLPGAVLETTS